MKRLISKNGKKLFSLLLCCLMLAGLLPMAAMADDRIEISEIEAISNISSIAVNGGPIQEPTFTVTKGSPARINPNMGRWWKKNGDSWEIVNSGSFTPGTWRYKVQLRIDADEGLTYKLAVPPSVTVDGETWTVPGNTMVFDQVSYTDVQSPEITIAESGELDFTGLLSYDIPDNYVGIPISSYNVSATVSGGTKPYVFSKTFGPDWITVKTDGTVSGTPTTVGINSNMFIRVTDSVGKWKEINVSVGDTLLAGKIIVSEIEATSNISSIAVNGGTIQEPAFTVTKGSPARINPNMGKWWKKNGDSWEIVNSGSFTPGAWRYKVQLRIDADDGLTYQLASPPSVTVDGDTWTVPGNTMIFDKVSYTDVQSPEIIITDYVPPSYFTVTFLTDYGTAPAAQTVKSGSTAAKPADPVDSSGEKVFQSWATRSIRYFSGKFTYVYQNYDFDQAVTSDLTLYARWEEAPAFAFTKQPVSGTAKKTEDYTYSWALSDTPDSLLIQAWFGGDWHDGSSLMGKTSDTISYSATISKYRIKATKGSGTVYSDEFTVTWMDSDSAKPTVTIASDGKSAKVTGDWSGLYARVALVLDNGGVSGLYITQATINPDGTILIPEFKVPGLTVKGVNVALVPTLADIQSSTPNAEAMATKMLST